MKERKILAVVLTLVLTLFMIGVAQAGVLLVGNNLTVGVSDAGALCDLTIPQGITYTGPGATLPNDWTLPGTPFEFYSIGVGGAFGVYGTPGGNVNPGGYSTINQSAGTSLLAQTDGPVFMVGGNPIIYTQKVVFDKMDSTIHVSADVYNDSALPITNVVYARGMDPDPDVFSGGGFATLNSFPGPGQVMAVGPKTKMWCILQDMTGGGVATISPPWATNPYVLLAGGGPVGLGDFTINMAWDIGTLGAYNSKEIDFQYKFGVPVPPSLLLFGSGLLGFGLLRRKIFG